MKLRAVIFDYGNVICRPPSEQQLSDAAALCGFSVEEFVQAFLAQAAGVRSRVRCASLLAGHCGV